MRALCTLTAALPLFLSVGAEAQPSKGADAAKIRAEIQTATADWLRTSRSPLDFDGFMLRYLNDPETVFANAGRIWKGWDAIRAAHEKIWAGWTDANFGYHTITTAVLGNDAATTTIEGDYSITSKSGQVTTGSYIATLVWQRTPQGWRIVQGHESFPRPR